MAYELPLTIADAIGRIEKNEFLLPDIQREFVWDTTQIEELFDSLMRGYPIGTFLFWDVDGADVPDYRLYDFVTDYDERTPHNNIHEPAAGKSVIAVLDGQQRLTALNIALRGSYTTKLPRKRRDDPTAYPPRHLHLNVLHVDDHAAPDASMYQFEFLTNDQATRRNPETFWVPVSKILDFRPAEMDHDDYLAEHGIDSNRTARRTLYQLTKLIHDNLIISAYHEAENDLDKVLNIFIRVNRGGTKLSYSDLLMSMATKHWTDRDAREEVHDLVDRLNNIGDGFDLSRDRVIKAAFVLSDRTDIKLKAANMLENMLAVEKSWDDIHSSLLTTMQLLAEFGFSGSSLRAQNAIIPVAYYVHHRNLDNDYLENNKHAADRALVRSWLIRTLLRSGFWTGAVDPILITARTTIRDHGGNGFPLDQLETAIKSATSKSLIFTAGDVDDLLLSAYRNPLTIPLLTLIFDSAVVRNAFHVDHVFPKSRLRKRPLERALADTNRPAADIDLWRARADRLPNLQLLQSKENVIKADQLPLMWADNLPTPVRDVIAVGNDLGNLPSTLPEWFDWYNAREERMRQSLTKALDVTSEIIVPTIL